MEYRELNQTNGESRLLRSVIYWITDITIVVAMAVFVVLFFCQKVSVTGHSMEPTLNIGEEVLIDQVRYQFSSPRRFDIILFEKENNGANKTYIKRVIGLPGETVQIINETIYINGEPLEAQTALQQVTLSGLAQEPITLGEQEYFVLGDNRDSSEDSRFSNIGNVKQSEICGVVWLRISPFENLGKITYPEE
jgi:signal peptidase I